MPTDIDYERYKDIDLENTVGIKPIKPPIVLRLQEIMRSLASQNAFSQIENPAEWQREIRQDKVLPR